MNTLSNRIPQAGLEFLLSRVMSPRASVDDVMWYVRKIYATTQSSDAEWIHVRERVARTVARMRGIAAPKVATQGTHRLS